MKVSASIRDKQLKFVEANLEKARKDPRKCGLAMKERGLYSPKTNDRDLEHFVLALIRRVEKKKLIEKQPNIPGLLSDTEEKRNKIGEEWSKQEDDRLLNLLFKGTDPDIIAVELKRNPKAVKRHIEEFKYNERNAATNYCPYRRYRRDGKKITALEKSFIDAHKEREIPLEVTAGLLQRKPAEIGFAPLWIKAQAVKRMQAIASSVDVLLAHRYLYWCAKQPVIPDHVYDDLKKEELEFGGAESVLLYPASDKVTDYPPHIRHLSFYLWFKDSQDKGKTITVNGPLPYGDVKEYEQTRHS